MARTQDLSRLTKIQLTRPILSLTVLRIVLGCIFVREGSGKLFGWFDHGGLEVTAAYFGDIGIPLPQISALLVGCTEVLGGVFLLLGLMTRIVVLPVAVIMLTAILTVHQTAGYYYPLVICASFLILGQSGAGHYSLDEYMAAKQLGEGERGPYVKLRDRG